ncbi:hypothetical protein AAMO2058_001420400 [Amorphochlora amoebiformis]
MSAASDPGGLVSGVVPPPDEKEEKKAIETDLARLQSMDYSCPICMELMDKPVKTPCNHVFCQGCLQVMKKKAGFCCPACRKDLTHFNPTKIDRDLRNQYMDANAKRVAAGLVTPDRSLRVIQALPNLPYSQALKSLSEYQRKNGLRPLPKLVVHKVRSAKISRISMETYVERRTLNVKSGSIPPKAAKLKDNTSPSPWSVPIHPDKFFTSTVLHETLPASQRECKDGGKEYFEIKAEFTVLCTKKIVVERVGLILPPQKLTEVESRNPSSWEYHMLPPGNPKKDAVKLIDEEDIKDAIVECIDAHTDAAKKGQQRILARRQAIKYYRLAEIECQYGRRSRRPFKFTIIQSSYMDKSPGGKNLFRPNQSVVWCKEYPVEAACCAIS